MSPFAQSVWESWTIPVPLTLLTIFAAFLYSRGWLLLRLASVSAIPSWRAASFFLGLFLIWAALGSPFAAFDEELLTVHMVQHLLLMTIAPPLILLGAPLMPLLHGLPRKFVRSDLGPVFCWPPIRRVCHVLSRPAFCWFAAAAALVGWHIPASFTLALHSEAWHVVEHASFLGSGFLFWWPVIQPWPSVTVCPRWSILLYLFLATVPCDILSAFLAFCDRVVYPDYLLVPRQFGISALADQQCAGALMWTCITFVYLVPAAILTIRLLAARSSVQEELPQIGIAWHRLAAKQSSQLGGRLSMASEPIVRALDVPQVQVGHSIWSGTPFDYWMLTKPEINFLIAITTAAAFYLGCDAPIVHFPWTPLVDTVLGTVLVASGANTLNQLIERNFDAKMRRTARRPIAAGRIEPFPALVFGTTLSFAGVLYLALEVRLVASLLALLTLGGYLLLYTPLKRRTPMCMLVGACPGAMPVLIGYVAASGKIDSQAWLLYSVLFLWQFPHFMAIAWMYREDYARAGFLVLPSGGLRDRFVICQSFGLSLLLLPLAMIPGVTGELHVGNSFGILAASFLFSYYAASFAFRRSNVTARRLLVASIIYLPAILALMMLNKR